MYVPRICTEFETIERLALKVPEDTDEMTETSEYVDISKSKGVVELNGKIKVSTIILSTGFILCYI